MLEAYERLLDAAAIIADGDRPDWEAVASTLTSDAERDVLRRLRMIAEIRSAHSARSFVESLSSQASAGQTADVRSHALPVGGRWGSLEIRQEIGRGRFGTVYRAWDPTLDRDVALKVLRRSRPADSEDVLVVEEGRLMARVRHPNVVTIHGAQRLDGQTGLWMELVEGRTLEAELAARGVFDAREVVAVGIELCRALTAVHEAGLVHRDVKTQNVLRDASTGRVVLGDFGTGREVDEVGSAAPIAGTPAYLAPEIFEGKPATPQSDLYSLGTLLFRLATGTFPIRGRSLREFREAHADDRRTSLRDIRPDVPVRLASAIERALEPDAGRRFASADAFASTLSAVFPSRRPDRLSRVALVVAVVSVITTVLVGSLAWRAPRQAAVAGARGGGSTALPPIAGGTNGARSFRQISTDAELAGPGGPSPDGRLLSYVNSQTGDLAIHEIATGQRRNVTTNARPYSPGYAETSRFTADGTRLIYVWYPAVTSEEGSQERHPALLSIPVSGGEPHQIWEAPKGSWLELRDWAGGDNEMLLAVGSPTGNIALIVLSSNGTVLGRVDTGRALHNGASLSIDGRTVAYDKADATTGRPALYVVGVEGGPEARLSAESSSDYLPIWTRDGRYLLFLSDRAGDVGLWAQPMDGARAAGNAVRLEPNIGIAWPMMGLTAAGALFMRRSIGTRDVLVASIDPSSYALAEEAKKLSGLGADHTGTPDWSPDGRRITFFSQRKLRYSLVIKSLDDGSEREISEADLMGVARPKWAPDGHSVYFKAIRNDRPGLHRVDVDTGSISTVIDEQIGRYEIFPNNGDVLYQTEAGKFLRRNAATRRDVLVHEVATGWSASRQVALSPDSNRLAYTASKAGPQNTIRVLRVVDLVNHSVHDVPFQSTADIPTQPVGWTRDGAGILVEGSPRDKSSGGCCDVFVVNAATGEARPTGIHVNGLMDISFSPDALHVAFDSGYPLQEAWVLENFLRALDQQR